MLKSIKQWAFAAVLAAVSSLSGTAQEIGLKTNLLYDATLTGNLGIEFGMAPRWSFDLSGNLKAWDIDDQTWKHWMVQPEARYWFCDRFAGHFVGFHGIVGQFNWGNFKHASDFLGTHFSTLKDYRAQGWGVGAGIAYGYTWILNRHWNFEAEIGLGWIHTWYDVYECKDCGRKVAEDRHHNYFGPTKAALNLVYVF